MEAGASDRRRGSCTQTPTLPPGSANTPYHKPGLHTLSQTIFKRRPEAWANLTYLQQPGTNSLDPGTPAPPTPTIAPVDVWLAAGGADDADKRLESIGEVPELEEIEVDEESESDGVSRLAMQQLTAQKAPDTDKAESIRSFTPSQEQEKPRKRKKKQVRFNLDHEEFFYEPEPDSRRILGLLGPRLDDEDEIGLETAVYQIGSGTKTLAAELEREASADAKGKEKKEEEENVRKENKKEGEEKGNGEKEPSPSPASPASPGSGLQAGPGKEDNKNDIGFTIYRDGY